MARRADIQYRYIFCTIIFLLVGFCCFQPAEANTFLLFQQVSPPDTTASDTAARDTTRTSYKPSKRPTYQPTDRYGDPFSSRTSRSPLYPSPKTQMEVEIDTAFNYTIYENLGEMGYRPITSMSLEEYNQYMRDRSIREYWKNQSAGLDGESPVSGRSLIPPIYTSPLFDRIFGGSFVNIRPNGFVNLDFGARFDRVENPSLPIRAQRRNQFQFDQQINMNVVGEIGEKLRVTANFDSNNSFDFENNFRVEYTGFEEEIIKKIELGNVSLPVRNSLMSGAQSLFGVKTQLQFGRLFITGVATTQRGEMDAIEIENGAQASTFSVRASQYDNNRHFFLGHFFRDNYGIEGNQWLNNLPQITSGVAITRLEVYVINRNNDTQTLRNIAAFADLGEGNPERLLNPAAAGDLVPGANQNEANQIFNKIKAATGARNLDGIEAALTPLQMSNGRDYVIMKSARKLGESEYTFNIALGYLTLNRQLQNDEALAVSYEYTYGGRRFQVGELSENYQEREASDIIFMKMLRPNSINTRIPTWDLMMKNIYNLNANQVSREGFQLRILYRDDRSTIDNPNLQEGQNTNNVPLIRLLGLDQLNQANDRQPDGNFDFIEGVTINLDKGNIIFPVLEPFGSHLEAQFAADENALRQKYSYDTLYKTTQIDAEQVVSKNKFFLTGSYSAGSTSEIALPGINIAEGSVRVMAGNIPLTEGIDYQVDYNFGRVRLLNEGVTNSGKKITISYEKASLLNFQTRRFLGTQFDYIFNEDFSIGGTLLYLNELPLVTRVSIGDEPTKNTKWGLDLNYRKDSRFLTRMVDKLPLIQTKELSTFSFNAEFAQMIPGTSNVVTGEGTSYIDDFEAAVTTYSLSNTTSTWNIAATPKTDDNRFFGESNGREFGFRRAKLAWYVIDNIFFNERDRGRHAPNLDKEAMRNHYFRSVSQQEIFKRDVRTYNPNELIFDLTYFPAERGSYNYNPNLNAEGKLPNPELNWGGITRAITSNVDFDQTNIEYLEFWMLDPFISGENGRNAAFQEYNIANEGSGGKLIFNLGNISEDYIKDKRHGFENGLPPTPEDTPEVTTTPWGRVTTRQYLNNAFHVDQEARLNQDVGMDGLRNDQEVEYFRDFINAITNPTARALVEEDPSADNFAPFVSEELTAQGANVITRYKNYNNQEGNTPINNNNSGFTIPSKATPDNEDLNGDNTINELEAYFQYEIDLSPANMDIGKGYIVDKVTASPPQGSGPATWYLFRIPIRNDGKAYGGITDFKSIRFMRTYLTGFRDPVVLRFAKMQLVGSQWRKTPHEELMPDGVSGVRDKDQTDLTVNAVSFEDNGIVDDGSIPYVIPPGFIRDRDNTAYNQNIRVNEQSIQLCVDDLPNNESRAVFKNVSLDLINYGRIKMLLHAQTYRNSFVNDDEVTAFLRLGYDNDNYYDIEVPLKITPQGSNNPHEIWPAENEIDISLSELYQLKAQRNRMNRSLDIPFPGQAGKHRIYVKGNPEMNNIVRMLIGVRNPNNSTDKSSKSFCIWANELRVTDFDSRAGWAGNARMNTRLADLADVSASTRYTSVGFGNISDKVSQRTREEMYSYDVAANIALEKFLPENSRFQLPMFVSFERSIQTPFFDPANPDLPLASTLESFETDEERRGYKLITQSRGTRRSLNFTNLRLTPKEGKQPLLISPENFSFTYAYSDVVNTSWEIANYELKTYKGAVGYNFTPEVTPIQPFANSEALNSPYLKWLKDFNFNLKPSSISARWDLDRRYQMRQLRNADLSWQDDIQYEKLFTMNRQYSLRWSITNALMFDYNARANAIIDEPDGAIDTDIKREQVMNNLSHLGRMKHFDQRMGLTYRLPLDKLPLTDWVNSEARYEAGYNWTAGSLTQQSEFGNTIQNERSYNMSGKMDLVKLYNKVGYFKRVNEESQRQSRATATTPRPGQRPVPNQPAQEAKKELGAGKGIARFLMSVRSVNFNYQRTQNTMLPGFEKRAFLFGLDSSFVAPGIPFLLGSQDPRIRETAAINGWMVQSQQLTTPFTQADGENFDIQADVQPFNDFRIQLDMKKSKTANYQEIFRYDSAFEQFVSLTPSRSGNYSMTYNIIATSFDKRLDGNGSAAFERFKEYREEILERLRSLPNSGAGEFTNRSQDALIPAFLAAYSGRDPGKVKLSPFPNIPLPNWRIDYAGLSKLKGIKERFSAFTIQHVYTSRYSVNNYTNSLVYPNRNGEISLSRRVEDYTSADNTLTNSEQGSDNLVPVYVASQVMISEQFAPLIGLSFRTKNRLTTTVRYNKGRELALNLSNTQLTEQNKRDIRVDVGYNTANFKLPFRSRGREIILKNEIAFKLGLTLMRNQIIQRKFDEPDDITNGNVGFQLNPTINYTVNQQLSVMMYYNSSVNDPLVLTSFRNSQTNFGVQLKYNITQ